MEFAITIRTNHPTSVDMNSTDITTVISGIEAAYEAFQIAKKFAILTGCRYCDLWDYNTGEVIDFLGDDEI